MDDHSQPRFSGPDSLEALTADREKMWTVFTTATTAAVTFVVIVLILLAVFLV